MRALFSAFSFLTVIPIPKSWQEKGEKISKSVAAFPLVGVAIGFIIAGLDMVLTRFFPAIVVGPLLVIVLFALTGGLHLDGLADTADGFLSNRPRRRVLEIMKDSAAGPMGAASIVCVLILKIAVFISVPTPYRFPTLLLTPLMGRASMVWLMKVLPYARKSGVGYAFSKTPTKLSLAASLVIPFGLAWYCSAWNGVLVCLFCAVVAGLLAFWSHHKIGGWTGDTLGAICEIEEVVPSLVIIACTTGRLS